LVSGRVRLVKARKARKTTRWTRSTSSKILSDVKKKERTKNYLNGNEKGRKKIVYQM